MPSVLGIAPAEAHAMQAIRVIACIASILLRKTRSKILCSPEGSHFAPQNKEDYMKSDNVKKGCSRHLTEVFLMH